LGVRFWQCNCQRSLSLSLPLPLTLPVSPHPVPPSPAPCLSLPLSLNPEYSTQWLRRADPVDKVYYLPLFIEWWEQWFSYVGTLPTAPIHTWTIDLPDTPSPVTQSP
jgi:hypothetical protein